MRAGCVLQIKEPEFSSFATQHDPARNPHLVADDPTLGRTKGPDVRNRTVTIEPLAERILAKFDNRFELLEAGRLKAVRLRVLGHQVVCLRCLRPWRTPPSSCGSRE